MTHGPPKEDRHPPIYCRHLTNQPRRSTPPRSGTPLRAVRRDVFPRRYKPRPGGRPQSAVKWSVHCLGDTSTCGHRFGWTSKCGARRLVRPAHLWQGSRALETCCVSSLGHGETAAKISTTWSKSARRARWNTFADLLGDQSLRGSSA